MSSGVCGLLMAMLFPMSEVGHVKKSSVMKPHISLRIMMAT
jgi:hypothetical protein